MDLSQLYFYSKAHVEYNSSLTYTQATEPAEALYTANRLLLGHCSFHSAQPSSPIMF